MDHFRRHKGTLADFFPILTRATFADIQNLTGGSLQDVFTFLLGGSLMGHINGGGGSNWLDYAALPFAIKVNLATGFASEVKGGVSYIEDVIGSAVGGDAIVGSPPVACWRRTMPITRSSRAAGGQWSLAATARNFLEGGNSDDIIIAGKTIFDANITALDAIFAEWGNSKEATKRVSAI